MHHGMVEWRMPSLGHCVLDLISDLVSRICIESGAYLLYSLSWEFQIWSMNTFCHEGVSRIIFGSL